MLTEQEIQQKDFTPLFKIILESKDKALVKILLQYTDIANFQKFIEQEEKFLVTNLKAGNLPILN